MIMKQKLFILIKLKLLTKKGKFAFFCRFIFNYTTLADKANFDIQKFQNSNGFYADSIGILKITEKNWHVATYIDLENFNKNFDTVKNIINEYHTFCRENDYKNFNDQDSFIEKKLSEIEVEKNEINYMLNNHIREKRSLGPLKYIGSTFRYLFGTLDETDKTFFDKNIERLDNSDNTILSLIENQTEIIKNKFLRCDQNFLHYNEELNKSRILVKNKTTIINRIMSYTSFINRFLSDLEVDTYTLIDAIIFANIGQLHPKLINHQNVQNLIKSIKLCESSYELPFSEFPSLYEISKIAKIIIYYNNNKIKFIINIPLLEKETYSPFRHYSVPHRLQNSSLFAFVLPNFQYTALNVDRDKYITFNEENLRKCTKNEEMYFCDIQPIYQINTNNPCEVKILLQKTFEIQKECDIRVKEFKQTIFQKLSKENTWIFFFPNKSQISIICNNFIYNEILEDSGIIHLEPQCKAKTNTILLKSTKVKKVVKSINIIQRFPDVNVSLAGQINSSDINILKNQENFNKIDQNFEKSENLDDIMQKIRAFKVEKQMQKIEKDQKLFHFVFLFIGVLLFLIVSIYITRKFFKRLMCLQHSIMTKRPTITTDENIDKVINTTHDTDFADNTTQCTSNVKMTMQRIPQIIDEKTLKKEKADVQDDKIKFLHPKIV